MWGRGRLCPQAEPQRPTISPCKSVVRYVTAASSNRQPMGAEINLHVMLGPRQDTSKPTILLVRTRPIAVPFVACTTQQHRVS